ncbi:predicted protein [Nematostella vectensis]|uniref:LicD/FKTN/FKRP nucleotidyltransferase domain-containing protein n=1 Tax=Nematostella vectensis TaxID=45351 RepID=A7RSB7_NEMVE|nr:predicted protein [Nematostella vectensis]|eukprot:XP_001637603.1 predicted protein [Nematostella vectensis]
MTLTEGLQIITDSYSRYSSTLSNGTKLKWGRALKHRWKEIYGEENCEDDLQKRKLLVTLLRTWNLIASHHNITYSLMYGSLLGVERTADILPWDHDLDIMVSYDGILKLERIANICDPRGHFDINDGLPHLVVLPNSEHNVFMDDRRRFDCAGKEVAKLVDACSIQEPLARLIAGSVFMDFYHYTEKEDNLISVPEGKTVTYAKGEVFPLKECFLMGVKSWCPKDPIRVLETWYGKGRLGSHKSCQSGEWVELITMVKPKR